MWQQQAALIYLCIYLFIQWHKRPSFRASLPSWSLRWDTVSAAITRHVISCVMPLCMQPLNLLVNALCSKLTVFQLVRVDLVRCNTSTCTYHFHLSRGVNKHDVHALMSSWQLLRDWHSSPEEVSELLKVEKWLCWGLARSQHGLSKRKSHTSLIHIDQYDTVCHTFSRPAADITRFGRVNGCQLRTLALTVMSLTSLQACNYHWARLESYRETMIQVLWEQHLAVTLNCL